MAKSHASDNPSHGKPLKTFFGNEAPTSKQMSGATLGNVSGKAKSVASKYVSTRNAEGRKKQRSY